MELSMESREPMSDAGRLPRTGVVMPEVTRPGVASEGVGGGPVMVLALRSGCAAVRAPAPAALDEGGGAC